MTLTKVQIVEQIVEQMGYPRNKSVQLVEILLEIIKRTLASGNDVMVSNFGKFCVQNKRRRKGRNPANGEEMMLDARKIVTFRCSANLRKAINRKKR